MNNEDIKVLEDMRDNIYGAMQFEDDCQVLDLEEKQFNALNLAIKHLRKTKLVKNNYIPKSKIGEIADKYKKILKKLNKSEDIDRIKAINERLILIQELLLQEGDK